VYNYLEAHAEREIEAGSILQYTRLQCVVATRADVVLPEFDDEEEDDEEEEDYEEEEDNESEEEEQEE